MTATLIPFRTIRFSIPKLLVLDILQLILDNNISYSIDCIDKNKEHLQLILSVNLSKGFQRNAITAIEGLLKTATGM